jgi:L-fuconolactonase
VGIRHLVQDEPDPNWLLSDDVRRGLAALEQAGLVYDLVVKPLIRQSSIRVNPASKP